MNIKIKDQDFELLPERAFYWHQEKILGFSDVHLGKAYSLQQHGIPVPSTDIEDLMKIAHLLAEHQPKKVLILGDFVHQKNSWTQSLFDELNIFFNEFREVEWYLILGNHERGSLDFLKLLPINIVSGDLIIEPFIFSHGHGIQTPDAFTIQGHVHPVMTIREGSTRLRLPCFVLAPDKMTIPSFGELTGGYEVAADCDERIFALTEESVFEVG